MLPDLDKYLLCDLFSKGLRADHLQDEWINTPVIATE